MRHLAPLPLAASFLLLGAPAMADGASDAPVSPYQAAVQAASHGPIEIGLRGQAMLDLPKGYMFVPQAQSKRLLEAGGSQLGDSLLGMVLPESPDADWMVVANFMQTGYIKDDDAKNWNADELLEGLREGVKADNEERLKLGIPALEVGGWVERPTYDATTKRLIWSVSAHDEGAPADGSQTINYNTFALGREGYISLNLVTDLDRIEADKPVAKALLGSLHFLKGKRYEDFDASTDHVAEYGLAALVAGVAAKKLGLFALVAVFFAKFSKLILLGVVGLGSWLVSRLLGRKQAEEAPEAEALESAVPAAEPAVEAAPEEGRAP